MFPLLRRGAVATLAVVALAFLPFSVDSAPIVDGSADEMVRVNEACGQATECRYAINYICVGNQDHEDYRCSSECGPDSADDLAAA